MRNETQENKGKKQGVHEKEGQEDKAELECGPKEKTHGQYQLPPSGHMDHMFAAEVFELAM